MTLPVAILAGGLATRMRPMTEKVPKALLEIAGEPFINHQLRLLRSHGVDNVVLCCGFLGALLEEHVGDGSAYGLKVAYSSDWPDLLGTGGALKKALPFLGEAFMVLYGDSYLRIDYADVAKRFLCSPYPALMAVYRNMGRFDTSNVTFSSGKILRYDKRSPDPDMEFIDYGLGCLRASVLADRLEEAFDLADVYAELSRAGCLGGYEAATRFYEIGSPEGLKELDRILAESGTA